MCVRVYEGGCGSRCVFLRARFRVCTCVFNVDVFITHARVRTQSHAHESMSAGICDACTHMRGEKDAACAYA